MLFLLVGTMLPACQEAVASIGDVTQDEKIDPPLLARLDESGPLPVAILLQSQLLLGPGQLEATGPSSSS
jgi:hypothetical protein